MNRTTDFYAEDLAFVHDAGFTGFITRAMPALKRLLREAGIADGVVVDLGCGSGRWLARLGELGYEAVGVDVSEAFLAMARKRAPDAHLIQGSLFRVHLPRARCVTAIGECVNYATADPEGAATPGKLFERVYSALEPGGLFVFDVALPGRVGPEGVHKFVLDESWAVLIDAREEQDSSALERRITTFRETGGTYQRSVECHRLHLWPAAELVRMLEAAGFGVQQLSSYGGLSFPPSYTAFSARKP